jgi:hypothetical protein
LLIYGINYGTGYFWHSVLVANNNAIIINNCLVQWSTSNSRELQSLKHVACHNIILAVEFVYIHSTDRTTHAIFYSREDPRIFKEILRSADSFQPLGELADLSYFSYFFIFWTLARPHQSMVFPSFILGVEDLDWDITLTFSFSYRRSSTCNCLGEK